MDWILLLLATLLFAYLCVAMIAPDRF
ncbi:MAG: K(+)-transporting ATPase subunit F [Gammaproteobacteria bacterium]